MLGRIERQGQKIRRLADPPCVKVIVDGQFWAANAAALTGRAVSGTRGGTDIAIDCDIGELEMTAIRWYIGHAIDVKHAINHFLRGDQNSKRADGRGHPPGPRVHMHRPGFKRKCASERARGGCSVPAGAVCQANSVSAPFVLRYGLNHWCNAWCKPVPNWDRE